MSNQCKLKNLSAILFCGVWQNFKTRQTNCLAIQHLICKSMTTKNSWWSIPVLWSFTYLFSILIDKNYEIGFLNIHLFRQIISLMFSSRGIIQNMSHYTILYDCFRSPVTDALLRVLDFMTYLLYMILHTFHWEIFNYLS